MKALLTLAIIFFLSCQVTAKTITLAKSGKACASIVVSTNCTAGEKTAANELASCLQKVTGAEFTVCNPPTAMTADRRIWVGASEPVRKMLPDVKWEKLSPDAIVIKTIGNDLVLAGGQPRGTIYAVYSFLEDVVGVRWWTCTEEFVPERRTLEIGKLNIQYHPQFRYREAYYRGVVFDHGLFAARLKTNGQDSNVPVSYGGNMTWAKGTFGHTFYQLLPPEVYFDKHPDWYSLINGKRTSDPTHSQLCLTNTEMRKELTRVALEWIRNDPAAGLISISQNDSSSGACECEKCKELVKLEGAQSGPIVHFVNAVAADIARFYPDILIHTFAYSYTQAPPRHVKTAPNVMVQLCSMGCSADSPLDSQVNKGFRDDMTRWSKVASNLFIWDYTVNFTNPNIPHPNLQVLAPNIRFFARNHVLGAFEQGDSATMSGDFVQLRAWVIAHLMWNPSLDEKKLFRDFLQGYYGTAGPYLSSYLNLVNDAFRAKGYHITCYNTETSFLTLAEMNKASELFNNAEKAVENDPVLLARVRRERLSLDHLWILRYSWLKHQAEITKAAFLGPADPIAACEKFISSVNYYTPGQYPEGSTSVTYLRNLALSATQKESTARIPMECAKLGPTRWLDCQEEQMPILYAAKYVDDPLASNGKAVSIPGNVIDWVVRVPITGDIAQSFPKAHCYVSVRCEAISKSPDDLAFSIGFYNESERKSIFTKQFYLKQFKDNNYQTFDLGTYTMKGGTFFWIIASGDADKIRSVNVDRLFMVQTD